MTNAEKFWNSNEVKTAQDIQRKNPWGNAAHKAAHSSIVQKAKDMNVLDIIEDLEIY